MNLNTCSVIRSLLSIVLLSAAFFARAESDRMRVAIFDPATSGPFVDEGTKVAVRELIGSSMVNLGDFTILERSMINKIMEELKFSNTDAVDENQASELGKLAGANKVVLSVISRAGTRNMLSIKIIDVETASIERQKAKVIKPDALLDVVEPMVAEMLGKGLSRSLEPISPSADRKLSVSSSEKQPEKPQQSNSKFEGIPSRESLQPNVLIGALFYLDKAGKTQLLRPAIAEGSKAKYGFKVAVKIKYQGRAASCRFNNPRPDLYVLVGPGGDISNVKLVQLEQSKNDRKYKFAVATAFGVSLCKDFIDVDVVDKGDGIYQITPHQALKKGSYGIYYQYGNSDPVMYDFDIE